MVQHNGFDATRILKGLKEMKLFKEVMSRVTIHSEKFLSQLLRKKNVFRFFRHWFFLRSEPIMFYGLNEYN